VCPPLSYLPSTLLLAPRSYEVKSSEGETAPAASRAAMRKRRFNSHPCQLSSNVDQERKTMSTDLFVPPPPLPSANSSLLPAPPPTADEPGRNQQSMPGQDRDKRVTTNEPQDEPKPDTLIPGPGVMGFMKDGKGHYWCSCWCGRVFQTSESEIRLGFKYGCGGPKHYLKTTDCERRRIRFLRASGANRRR